jgi:actin-related protein 6
MSKQSSEQLPAISRLTVTDSRHDPRRNPIVQEYVLPDFSPSSTSRVGYIRSGPNAAPPDSVEAEVAAKKRVQEGEEEQVLFMGNERFAGPELLFNPSDIGESLSSTG